MPDLARAHMLVRGHVQGVGYRAFVWDAARQHGLRGGVRNLPDGRVEVEVEGERSSIEALLRSLKKGPSRSRVTDVSVSWPTPTGQDSGFHIWD